MLCRHQDDFPEEEQRSQGRFDTDDNPYEGQSDSLDDPVDESLDVLPQGISAAPEVYSPMSHGATRVRSMITNRPFMLEDPVSPVAQRLGATMHRNSQVTFSDPDVVQNSMAVAHVPSQSQEQLHHDWWESAAPLPDQTLPAPEQAVDPVAETAAEAEAAAVVVDASAEDQANLTMSRQGTFKRPPGKLGKLANGLFRRSTKRTAETQTTETKEDETQTVDDPEAEAAAQAQAQAVMNQSQSQPQLGGELSFGDALKTQTAPAPAQTSPGQAGVLLSDLIEEHGPLAMNAMSSPVHTSPLARPLEQHSPAQLAGCGQAQHSHPDNQALFVAQPAEELQQAGFLPNMMSANGNEMTFQVMHASVAVPCKVSVYARRITGM